ncbi:MAG: hypothetical protein ABH952_07775 [Candidatus Omnitrophota bacterium]
MAKQFESLQARILKQIRRFYKYYPEIRQFSAMPGIGQVRAFTISAIIDAPIVSLINENCGHIVVSPKQKKFLIIKSIPLVPAAKGIDYSNMSFSKQPWMR